MAYFAQLDENNIVLQVIVAESQELCEHLFNGVWKETFETIDNKPPMASIGYKWDEELKGFIAPKPFSKWILNKETLTWEAPIPQPVTDNVVFWNDELNDWEIIN